MNAKVLRKKYPRFIYKNYSYKIKEGNLEIFFLFEIEPDIFFKPKIIIENVDKNQISRAEEGTLNNLIFHLGLIEMFSYWKATCSPEIEIQAGYLSKEQIKWWKELIVNGLGQFFYENKINFQEPNFVKIHCLPQSGKKATIVGILPRQKNRVLIPIGGGKDSAVTLEILKRTKKDLRCFSLNPTKAAQKIMKIGDCKNPLIVRRKIDDTLLELNRQGFLNGHTPFSAYLAFLSVILAEIFGLKYIAFSQERSSNEGNLKYLGKSINHQYSKSFDFEKKFREYLKRYLAKDAEYFSFLRPLYEIQIAKLFSQYPRYFDAFLSCNEAYKTYSGRRKPIRKWCGNCPKCLFVFAILYPFLGQNDLVKIFKQNLFEKKELLPVMQELIGERRFKPFECVGTKKECLVAFYLSWKKFCGGPTSAKLPFLLEYFQNKVLPKERNLEGESQTIMKSWNKQNYLPEKFDKILRMVYYQNGSFQDK